MGNLSRGLTRPLVAGATQSGAGVGGIPPIPRSQKLLGISTRLHLPFVPQTASAGREVLYSSTHVGFPPIAGVTDWRSAWPHFYCNEDPVGNPQATDPEVDIPNDATVYATLGIAGVFTGGLFDGASSGAMVAGMWGRWCRHGDPTYTPSGTGKFRSAHVVATGAIRPAGFARQSGNSEAAEWAATLTLSKIQTGGTITHNAAIPTFYGPCLLIGRGMDDRLVPAIFDNSLGQGRDENAALADSRGNLGFWQRGFDDAADRRPYVNFAVPGSRYGLQSSLAAGAFRRRGEIFKSIETGPPFDYGCGSDENAAQTDSIVWRQFIDDFADFINDVFGMPFRHRTMLPKVSYIGNGRVALSEMTAAVDDRLDTNTNLIAVPGSGGPTFQIGEAFHDDAVPGKWKVGPFTSTVAANYAGSGAISLNHSPALGTYLVFNNGLSGVAIRTVTAVSGAGPFNVTCSTAPPVQNQNDPVASTATDGDGTHYSTAECIARGVPVVIAGKAES